MSTDQALRKITEGVKRFRLVGRQETGVLCRADGTCAVADRPGYAYVRVARPGGEVEGIYRCSLRLRPNTPVKIATDPLTGEQVVADADWDTADLLDERGDVLLIQQHANTHEWRADADDRLDWLSLQQIYFWRVQTLTATPQSVAVLQGALFKGGQLYWKSTVDTVDLSAYFPVSGYAWIILTIDIAFAYGVVQGGTPAQNPGDLPPLPMGEFGIAAIKLTAGAAINMFTDIIPLWAVDQFDASALGGDVTLMDDGLVVGTDYPDITGAWVLVGGQTGECGHDLRGLHAQWDTDKAFFGLVDHGSNRKDTAVIFGDDANDHFLIIYCDSVGDTTDLADMTADGVLAVVDTVAAGDYGGEDYDLQWAKIGLMTTIAGLYGGVGLRATWAQASAVLALIDLGATKDLLLGYLPATGADKIQIGFMLPGGGLDTALTITQDANIEPKTGATFDGVDVSEHDHSGAGEGGTVDFLSLGQVPGSFVGQGGKYLAVNPGETALEFVTGGGGGGGGGDVNITFQARYWTVDGPLAAADEVGGVWRVAQNFSISAATAYLYATGSSGSTIVDFERSADGGATWATLFTTPGLRPTIAAGAADKRADSVPDETLLYAGDLLRLCIDQVATGARGLSAQIDGEVALMSPTLYAITLTSANTEYSQALPAGLRALSFKARTSVAVRWAFVTGKVATPTDPYETLAAGQTYFKEGIVGAAVTLYLASSTAGTVVEVEAWA